MTILDHAVLLKYWSLPFIAANAMIALNCLGALVLGMVVGYERSYRGRAAGMRTYGLVSMSAAAMTVFVGYSHFWYGGTGSLVPTDPTRVVQGVVSGIGFLCAGVVMKNGLNISGLTTAASIWSAAAMGVMVGVGFYGAAIAIAVLCVVSMGWVRSLASKLPTRPTLGVTMTFEKTALPDEAAIANAARREGYEFQQDSLSISAEGNHVLWRFTITALQGQARSSLAHLASELSSTDRVVSFSLEHTRN